MTVWSNSTPSNSLVITTSPTAHDVLIAGLVFDSTSSTVSTWPSGFSQVGNQSTTADGQTLIVGIKNDASGSEGNLTFASSNQMIGFVLSVPGCDNTTPQDVTAVITNNNTATASPLNLSTNITPTTNGAIIVSVMGGDIQSANDVTFSFSTTSGTTGSWTTQGDITSGFYNIGVGTATQTTAGAITVQSRGTSNGNSLGGAAIVLALRPASGGAVTHTGSGTISGSAGAVAGTATHYTKHTASGVLAGSAGVVAGIASTWTVFSASGVLSGSSGQVVGSATRYKQHSSSGVLEGSAGAIEGSAARWHEFTSSGVLAGSAGTVEGTATHLTLHTASGVLAGGAGVVDGAATITPLSGSEHTADGVLAGSAGVVEGTASHLTLHSGSGTLSGPTGIVAGTAVHSGPGASIGVVSGGGGGTQKKRKKLAVLEIDGKQYVIPANDVQSFLNSIVKADKKKAKKQEEEKEVPAIAPAVRIVEVAPEIEQVVVQKVDKTNELLLAAWNRAIERELEEEEELIWLLVT